MRSEVAAAGLQGDFPQLEVGEELVPFGGGEVTVFFAGPLGAAAGDERPRVGDDAFGVDRGLAHGGVQQGVPADFRGDVRRQPGPQGVGTKILRKSWGRHSSVSPAAVICAACEGTRVEGGPGLGEHHRHPLAQQPPVGGPDDLPGHEQDEAREQLVAVMRPDRDTPLQRQFSRAGAGGVGPAGQPPLLPGASGLQLEPVQQLGQPPPPGLIPGQARAWSGEQARQPPRQVFPALPRLPPVLLAGPRLPC